MTATAKIPTQYRTRAFTLYGLAALICISGLLMLFKAVAPGNSAHWPAVYWLLSEFAALFTFLAGMWQYKRHLRAQPGFVPEE